MPCYGPKEKALAEALGGIYNFAHVASCNF